MKVWESKTLNPLLRTAFCHAWGCMLAQEVGKLVFIDDTMDKHLYLFCFKKITSSAGKIGVSRHMSIIQLIFAFASTFPKS